MITDPAQPVEDLEDIVVPEDEADVPKEKEVDLEAEESNDVDFKKLDNKAFAAMRKEAADAKRERDELRLKVNEYKEARPTVVQQAAPVVDIRRREMIGGIAVPESKEEWDALARKDWQVAVDLRSVINARKVRDEHVALDAATKTLNDSKTKVIERHPELNDGTSEKGKIYLKILERNPEYINMVKGPILAMRDMEDEMEAQGFTRDQIYASKKVDAQKEVTRVNRATLTGGGRMPEKQGRVVSLSKDDMEFCKSQGIDPKDYAKEKLNLENRQGAQL